MITLGPDEMAKYPFLADAGQYLKDKQFTLEQFGTDPDLKPFVDKAFNRIEVAADGKIYKSDLVNSQAGKAHAFWIYQNVYINCRNNSNVIFSFSWSCSC